MTLKELSLLAGVSVSTISRVVNKNDSHAASEEVRDRIWQLVHETGYVPNSIAQSLKLNSSAVNAEKKHSITCVFARTPDGRSDPFFSQIFHAVEHECIKNKYDVTGVFSAPDIKKASNSLTLSQSDGIIVMGRYSRSLMQLIRSSCKNVVYTGLNSISDPYDQIVCDGYQAAKTAVKHLYMLGHRKIGYIGEKSSEERYRGYYDSIQELKLPLCREHIVETEQSLKGGYQSGLKILTAMSGSSEYISTPPTAIFCANDITAIGVMKAMHERGVSIPDDISIVSIDNTEMCQYATPMLTSVDIPKDELGKFAVKIMIDRINGGHRMPVKIEIPFTLISRESCALLKST